MREIIAIVHNIRSTHNVGSIFRTCEGFGVSRIILGGYTPYPQIDHDPRLPHIAAKLTSQIHKTALGAETLVPFEHTEILDLEQYKSQGYHIAALEQHESSKPLAEAVLPDKVALLLGEEVDGIHQDHLAMADTIVEIPMYGQKESFNVSVAAGIALYELVRTET